jgi:hypothetical protein
MADEVDVAVEELMRDLRIQIAMVNAVAKEMSGDERKDLVDSMRKFAKALHDAARMGDDMMVALEGN